MKTFELNTPKYVQVVLEGGIGNQLFMFIAGLYLAKSRRSNLRTFSPTYSKAYGIHGSSIENFDLSRWAETTHLPFELSFTERLQNKLISKFFLNSTHLRSHLRYYQSTSLGYDEVLEQLTSPVTIKGYFQTYKYLRKLLQLQPNFRLELLNPSQKFRETVDDLDGVMLRIVHVRRGDYRHHKKSIGVLGVDYFKSALEMTNSRNSQTLILSDEIDAAKEMLCNFVPRNSKWIGSSDMLPEESLALMWHGKQFILSNSSFGYWGAIMAEKPMQVVAPSKWFKGQQDPLDLIPVEWTRTQSIWEL